MKDTIEISKKEYRQLRLQAKAYQKLAGQLFSSALSGSVIEVVEDFRKTDLYSESFLKDLESGLGLSVTVK